MQQLHNLREAWKKTRVQHINLLRGILRELGVAAPSGTQAFLRQACELIVRCISWHCYSWHENP